MRRRWPYPRLLARISRIRLAAKHLAGLRALRRGGYRERGNTTAAGILATLVFLLISAGLVDLYNVQAARDFAYQAASDAALRGVSKGRDWGALYSGGQLALDKSVAEREARSGLSAALAARGITAYTADVRVLPDPGGGTVPGFPPVPWASQKGSSAWTATEPSVGVYVEIPVNVTFFGWVDGSGSLILHAFAAAGVAGRP